MVISLEGNWNLGMAYDIHTMASEHIGFDEFVMTDLKPRAVRWESLYIS